VIRSVLRAYRAGAGFADALIAALNAHEGRKYGHFRQSRKKKIATLYGYSRLANTPRVTLSLSKGVCRRAI
jgi:hypothetical protein